MKLIVAACGLMAMTNAEEGSDDKNQKNEPSPQPKPQEPKPQEPTAETAAAPVEVAKPKSRSSNIPRCTCIAEHAPKEAFVGELLCQLVDPKRKSGQLYGPNENNKDKVGNVSLPDSMAAVCRRPRGDAKCGDDSPAKLCVYQNQYGGYMPLCTCPEDKRWRGWNDEVTAAQIGDSCRPFDAEKDSFNKQCRFPRFSIDTPKETTADMQAVQLWQPEKDPNTPSPWSIEENHTKKCDPYYHVAEYGEKGKTDNAKICANACLKDKKCVQAFWEPKTRKCEGFSECSNHIDMPDGEKVTSIWITGRKKISKPKPVNEGNEGSGRNLGSDESSNSTTTNEPQVEREFI